MHPRGWYGSTPAARNWGNSPRPATGTHRISPDGRFLAVSSDDDRNGKRFIRIHDLQRGVSTRLTEGGNEEFPTWSRDGRRITYLTGAASGNKISMNEVPVDGSGPPQRSDEGRHDDTERLVGGRPSGVHGSGEGALTLKVYSAAGRQSQGFAAAAGGAEAQFSPDGRWIAHSALGAGRNTGEIVVQPFPGPGGRIQISSAGGSQPRWSRDGTRIFYIQPDKKLMQASFDPRTGSARHFTRAFPDANRRLQLRPLPVRRRPRTR